MKHNLEWKDIKWPYIENRVRRIQHQIFIASKEQNNEKVHHYQQILTGLIEAKILAVRKVTQDNQGKKSKGVDKIANLPGKDRISLVRKLKIDGKSDNVRRIWIPKPGSTEKRPLGVPTIRDRAKQALALLALEPQWEAKFEPNSYGFRPGRSTWDAIEAIHSSINKSPKYVLDADIRKCFDSTSHKTLLEKMQTYPIMRKQLKAWLKAAIVDGSRKIFPEKGTSQGGILSPLLSNVALHGIEEKLKLWIEKMPAQTPSGGHISKTNRRKQMTMVRYADDFVVLHRELDRIKEAREIIQEELKLVDLELHPDKTNIRHTLEDFDGSKPGFKFLGFSIRQYYVSKPKRTKRQRAYRTIIMPHKDNMKALRLKTKSIARTSQKIGSLVERINPVTRGWANYFRTVVSKKSFSAIDKTVMIQLMKWAKRKHSKRSYEWIKKKYLFKEKNRLKFGYLAEGNIKSISPMALTPIKRHIKVKGAKSPYDQDWLYWCKRRSKIKGYSLEKLIGKQKGKCPICLHYIRPTDLIEIDHITSKSRGGKNNYSNLQVIHRHCHDQKVV